MHPSDAPSPPAQASGSSNLYWVKDLCIIGLIALVWICGFLNVRPLLNPDEGRYTEIPREMALSGDFVTPRLNGLKYFEKPPLLYWLSALTFRATGMSEFTARLWNGLFGVAGVLLVYWAGRRLYGRAAGIWSSVILGTCVLYYSLSQILVLDMAVAVTMSGALFSFLLAADLPPSRSRFRLLMTCYVCMALATLTKGLIGFVLPGCIIFLWALLLKRWKNLFPAYLLAGGALFLLIAAPWHILAARANPDFLSFYFVHEQFLRFTTRIHHRYAPWWFLLPFAIGGLFPWVFFAWNGVASALRGGWKARQQNPAAWFLVTWIVFIVAFFSKSQSKLVPYVLPIFPAAAVLLGPHLARLWNGRSTEPFRKAAIFSLFLACILAAGLLFFKGTKSHPELTPSLPLLKAVICGGLTAAIAAISVGLVRRQPRLVLSGIAAIGISMLMGLHLVGRVFDSDSTKELAKIIKPGLRPEDRVYCLRMYCQDLPVYLERQVSVVGFEGELEFGIDSEPEVSRGRFLSREEFGAEWQKPGHHYAVLRKAECHLWFPDGMPFEQLGESNKLILVSSQYHSTESAQK